MLLKFAMAAAAVLLSSSAFAHASIAPSTAMAGASVKVAISVPHGCDGAPTDKVTVIVPEGFVSAKPQVKAGWQAEVTTGDYAESYDVHGQPVTSGAVSVTWSGGSIPDDQFDEFVLQGTVSSDAPLAFATTQWCGTDSVAWDQIAAAGQDAHALEHPAPVLKVTAAEGGDDMHHDHGATPDMAGMPVTAGDLEITGAFTRATLPNAPVAGGYLTISNTGTTDDRLVSASTPAAGMSQIHEMKMEGDVMKMNELPEGLVLPAGGSVSLAPGGYHLMFMDLTGPLVEGGSITVTLTFEKAGTVDVEIPIGSPAAKGPAEGAAMDHSMHSERVTVRHGDLA